MPLLRRTELGPHQLPLSCNPVHTQYGRRMSADTPDTPAIPAEATPPESVGIDIALASDEPGIDLADDIGIPDAPAIPDIAANDPEVDVPLAANDPRIDAVWFARGGYGSMRLLPELPLDECAPPALVGFSDITAVHLAMQAVHRVSIHGPVLTQLGRQPPDVHERLFRLLESPEPPPPLTM